MNDFLVKELRDEHRDREWVDAYGYHWAWREDAWVCRLGREAARNNFNSPNKWIDPTPYGRTPNTLRDGYDFGPGPFMEAMHHRLIWEDR